jgi:hypothetical protein
LFPGEAPLLVRLLPLAWASLVIMAGPAAASALDTWSPPARLLASVVLWAVWATVLLATLVPRPSGLTVLRVAAPLGLVLALAAAPSTTPVAALAAVVGTAAVTVAALLPSVGFHFVNGAAYGDERRFPLRVPTALLLGPVPLAVVLVGLGAAAGPLLLADGRYAAGALALLAGGPAAWMAGRSLYALSQRWAVLVPAGLVVKDPLTMVDPVLFPRERIASLRPLPYPSAPADDIVDLRLGTVKGSLVLELTDEAVLYRTRGRHRGGEAVSARRLAFSPGSSLTLLADAAKRRIAAGS